MKEVFPDAQVQLVEGSGGIFDVRCSGKLIYSKLGVSGGRFPYEGEITRLIKQAKS